MIKHPTKELNKYVESSHYGVISQERSSNGFLEASLASDVSTARPNRHRFNHSHHVDPLFEASSIPHWR